MNIKTSFFNGTVLKKDLTRFWPVWTVYSLFILLVIVSNCLGLRYDSATLKLIHSLRWLGVVQCAYALLLAQLLFGELFTSQLCNAVHALPVRREGLFLTHFTAGLIMGIGPSLVVSQVVMASLGRFWYLSLLWAAGIAMMFLLFFGVAVFSMLCSGNRIAGVAFYSVTNVMGVVAMWFFETFFLPMLYGLQMDKYMKQDFYRFSPVFYILDEYYWMDIWHSIDCTSDFHYCQTCLFELEKLSDIWGYLGILSAIGIVFAAVALLLYRSRKLESAGDFMAVKPFGMVFTFLTCLCVGALGYRVLGEHLIGMAVGVVLAYFVCRMLLERKFKVFGLKNWLKLVLLCIVLTLTLGVSSRISYNVSQKVPDTDDVVSVTISERELDDYDRESIRRAGVTTHSTHENNTHFGLSSARNGYMRLVETCQIEDMLQIHQMLREEDDASEKGYTGYDLRYIAVHYLMKDGSTMTRHYYTYLGSPVMEQLKNYGETPEYRLGVDNPEAVMKNLRYICYNDKKIYNDIKIADTVWMEKLTQALYDEVSSFELEGYIDPRDNYIKLVYSTEDGEAREIKLGFRGRAEKTIAVIEEYLASQKTAHNN